jgi:hypothetical protein
LQDPTEKHFGDVSILDKYEDNNNKTPAQGVRSVGKGQQQNCLA